MTRSLFAELEDLRQPQREVRVETGVTLRPYQVEAVDAVFREWEAGHRSTLVCLPTGCHAAGHPILRHDGTVVVVEDVRIGDVLIGSDGGRRRVLNLVRGEDEMYRITPKKGPAFVVNGGHILHLECTREKGIKRYPSYKAGGEVDHISVSDYLSKSKSWRHLRKLRATGVNQFQNDGLAAMRACVGDIISPYVLGALLGDGSIKSGALILHSQDQEIATEFVQECRRWGCDAVPVQQKSKTAIEWHMRSGGKHSQLAKFCRTQLRNQKCGDKVVPHWYRTGNVHDRLELLAGLLDTDGSLSDGGVFDFVSLSLLLAEDVQFVARSIGFRANLKPCKKASQYGTVGSYYRVQISGDIERIPCRVPRKQAAPRRQKKNWQRYGFTVEHIGRGNYYGFQVDGDHLYLDGNFMVHHNCGKSVVLTSVIERILDKAELN